MLWYDHDFLGIVGQFCERVFDIVAHQQMLPGTLKRWTHQLDYQLTADLQTPDYNSTKQLGYIWDLESTCASL